MTEPDRSDRRGRVPSVSDDEIRTAVAARLYGTDASPETTGDEDGQQSAKRTREVEQETSDTVRDPTEDPLDGDGSGGSGSDKSPDEAEPDDTTRPFIKITPAREQVTPGHVVKALYGLYRTGSGRQMPLGLEQRLSFVSTHLTFEFLIHKPRATQRFDFYLGVRPYEREAFETLAANVRAMYPESFRFEIVPFSVTEVFEPSDLEATAQLAAFEGIEELGQLEGFEPFDVDADHPLVNGHCLVED